MQHAQRHAQLGQGKSLRHTLDVCTSLSQPIAVTTSAAVSGAARRRARWASSSPACVSRRRARAGRSDTLNTNPRQPHLPVPAHRGGDVDDGVGRGAQARQVVLEQPGVRLAQARARRAQ